MPQVQIGPEGNSKTVEVGDEFLKLSPEEQQHTINDIAKQLGYTEVSGNVASPAPSPTASPEATPPAAPSSTSQSSQNGTTGWRPSEILPLEHEYTTDSNGRMHDTGATRWAWPQMITSLGESIALPGQVMRGEVDPNSEAGFNKTMGLAMMGVSPIQGGGAAGGAAAKAVETTTEPIPAGMKAALATPAKGEIKIAPAPKPIPNSPSVTQGLKPTAVDQELDNFLNTQSVIAKAKVGEEKARPKAEVTGTMGGQPVNAKANITGTINGPLSVTAQLGDAKGIELKLQAGKRFMSAAQRETNQSAKDFQTNFQQSMALEGMKTSPRLDNTVAAFKPAIATLKTPEQVANFSEGVAKAVANTKDKSSLTDKIFEVWLNQGLFSGPASHMANTLGNLAVNAYTSSMENGLTALLSKVTGSGFTLHEAAQRAIGDFEGVGDALRATAESFKTERGLFDAGIGSSNKIESPPAISGPLGRFVRVPTRALTAEDAFFKSLAYRQEINGLAVRNATKEGLKGDALAKRIVELKLNPTDEMRQRAILHAKTQTFTDPLGKFAQRGLNFLESHKALRFIVPIYRTPIKILTYATKRSVLAPLFKDVRNDLMGRNGAIARDQAISRMTLGTALSGWAFHEALKDNVTGGGPSNSAERAVWKQTHQPYSVKINGQWYSYSRIEPFGTLLGAAADMHDLGKEMKSHEIGDVMALLSTIASRQLVNKTWLQGPANLAQAINNPKEYGPQYIQQMLGTIVPNLVAQVAKANDPYMREVHSIMDNIKSRIPGYRETLNMRRDSAGEPIMNEGGFLFNLLSPIAMKEAKNNPVVAEMLRLHAIPSRLEPKIMTTDLLPQEWDSYTTLVGQLTTRFATAIMSNPQFKEWSDPIRKMALEEGFNKARDAGRDLTMAKFPDLILRMAQNKAAIARGYAAPPVNTNPMNEPLPEVTGP